MKNYKKLIVVAFGAMLLQGCIAFPPLVQVEHKHATPAQSQAAPASNQEVLKRLDAIDQRLDQIEKSQGKE